MENIIKKIKSAREDMKGIVKNPTRRKAMLLALVASTNLALSGCGKTNNPTLREVAEENNKITYMDELLDDENDMVGIYESSQLVYLSFGEAIDLLKNRIDLINRLEKSKVKKYDATNNSTKKEQLKQLNYEEAIVLIEKFNKASKGEKENLGPQVKYLLDYYQGFLEENSLALCESMLKREIKSTVALCLHYDADEYDNFEISPEERDILPYITDEENNHYTLPKHLREACNTVYRTQQARETNILSLDQKIEFVAETFELCKIITAEGYYYDGEDIKALKR